MSSITWTPAELSSELNKLKGTFWRAVEAQHFKSTMKLADSLQDQQIIEEEIESVKPPVPAQFRHLEFLLYTPFRYKAPYPNGSRFRRAGNSEGVLYCSQASRTAMAEMAFLRLLFIADSPRTALPVNPAEYTAFAISVSSARALDLTSPPLNRDAAIWQSHSDYAPCQALADLARACSAELIQYESVRDPDKGKNLAVLSPQAIAVATAAKTQSWHMQFQQRVAWARCEAPRQSVVFDLQSLLQDPRLAALRPALSS